MHPTVMHSRTAATHGEIEWVRAGVDWLSCTLQAGAAGAEEWKLACVHALSAISDSGYDTQVRPLNGYRGLMVGGSFWGEREDGQYLQLSGIAAQEHFSAVARPGISVSRIDLAVTLRYQATQPDVGKVAYREAIKSAETLGAGRTRRVWYMSGNDGGYTLYIGSPSSKQRGRLYNKEVQSKTAEYERCWRWEVVFRDNLADQVYHEILNTHTVLRPHTCAMMVASWYELRGVRNEWAYQPGREVLPIVKGLPSDADRKLRWLRTQVRPAVNWLLEHGYEREMLEALDIGDYTTERFVSDVIG